MNKTKIISQLTQSNSSDESIRNLMENGIDLFLMDLNEVNKEFCLEVIRKINDLNDELKTNVGSILELRNNKIRINKISGGSAYLKEEEFNNLINKLKEE